MDKQKSKSKMIRRGLCLAVFLLLTAAVLCGFRQVQGYLLGEDWSVGGVSIMDGPLTADRELRQPFTTLDDTLDGLRLCFGTYARENKSTLELTLEDASGKTLTVLTMDCADLRDNIYTECVFDGPVAVRKGEQLTLVLRSTAADAGQAVMPYINGNAALGTELVLNGTAQNGQRLVMQPLYAAPTLRWALPLGILLVAAMGLLMMLRILPDSGPMPYEKLWLVTGGILLVGLAFALPMFGTLDETTHFLRAYEISTGHLLSQMNEMGQAGRVLPAGLIPAVPYNNTWQIWQETVGMRLSATETQFYDFFNTALYSPLTYLPQSLGIALAHLFTDRVTVLFYAGRLGNALAALLAVYGALRLAPVGKAAIFTVACLVMSLQGCASLSADGFALVISLLLTAFVLRLRAEQGKLQRWELVLVYLLPLLLGQLKIVYVPLCLLLFLIPHERFGSEKAWRIHTLCCGILLVVTSLGWLRVSALYLSDSMSSRGSGGFAGVVQMLKQPLQFPLVLLRTLFYQGRGYLVGLLGVAMGTDNVALGYGMVVAQGGLLIAALVLLWPQKGKGDTVWFRVVCLGSAAATFMLIFLSLYAQWTQSGSGIIEGVQGRYFLPLLLPVWLGLAAPKQAARGDCSVQSALPFAAFSLGIFSVAQILLQTFCL